MYWAKMPRMAAFSINDITEFFLEHKILLQFRNCPSCKRVIPINKNTTKFRCDRTAGEIIEIIINENGKEIQRRQNLRCRFRESARSSWIANSKLDMRKWFQFVILILSYYEASPLQLSHTVI